jgi:hypothetical protein
MSRNDLGLRWVVLMFLFALPDGLHADSIHNILVNPDFSTGSLSPWFVGGKDCFGGPCIPWAVIYSDTPTGAGYVAVDTGNIQLRQDFTSVADVAITDLSFWIKTPAIPGLGAIGYFYFSDGSAQEYILAPTDTTATGWNFVDVSEAPSSSSACFNLPYGYREPCLPDGKRLDGISVWGYEGGPPGTLPVTFVHDFTVAVEKTPEPGSVLLLGTALAALTARRKIWPPCVRPSVAQAWRG